jgi:kynureninase
VRRFLAGTPNVPALVAIEEGVKLVAEAGVDRLRAKAEALTSYAVELHDAWLTPLGFELWSPRDPARRGAHISIRHEHGWPICRALIERAKVIPDFREPDLIRLGLAPLYTRFVDVHEALDRLRELVLRDDYDRAAPRARVT